MYRSTLTPSWLIIPADMARTVESTASRANIYIARERVISSYPIALYETRLSFCRAAVGGHPRTAPDAPTPSPEPEAGASTMGSIMGAPRCCAHAHASRAGADIPAGTAAAPALPTGRGGGTVGPAGRSGRWKSERS